MNNKNNRKPNNYFEQQKSRLGENFLQTKNSRELQFDAIRVFRDVVRGKLDVREYGAHFLDTQFMESCLTSASQKQAFHQISFNGVNMLTMAVQQQSPNIPVDPMILATLDYHQKAADAYALLLQGLNAVKQTGDIEYLLPIANQLRNYRDYV